MELLEKNYQKYRWFFTLSGKLVVGGKSAEQNEELLQKLKQARNDYIVMHTAKPGSPFLVIVAEINKVTKKDKEECAIFTACFSQAWKKGKNTQVHIFNLSHLEKNKEMKTGTWAVVGKVEKINAELKLVLIRQKGILRAVPPRTAKKSEILGIILPGKKDKNEIISGIEKVLNININRNDILSALPAGGLSIKRT